MLGITEFLKNHFHSLSFYRVCSGRFPQSPEIHPFPFITFIVVGGERMKCSIVRGLIGPDCWEEIGERAGNPLRDGPWSVCSGRVL